MDKRARDISLVTRTDGKPIVFLSDSKKWNPKPKSKPKEQAQTSRGTGTTSRTRNRKAPDVDDKRSEDDIEEFTTDDRLPSDGDEIEEMTPSVRTSSRKRGKPSRDIKAAAHVAKRKNVPVNAENEKEDRPAKRVRATSERDQPHRSPIDNEQDARRVHKRKEPPSHEDRDDPQHTHRGHKRKERSVNEHRDDTDRPRKQPKVSQSEHRLKYRVVKDWRDDIVERSHKTLKTLEATDPLLFRKVLNAVGRAGDKEAGPSKKSGKAREEEEMDDDDEYQDQDEGSNSE